MRTSRGGGGTRLGMYSRFLLIHPVCVCALRWYSAASNASARLCEIGSCSVRWSETLYSKVTHLLVHYLSEFSVVIICQPDNVIIRYGHIFYIRSKRFDRSCRLVL
jgi:hypothetical protein